MSWISFWIKPEAIPARITLGEFEILEIRLETKLFVKSSKLKQRETSHHNS